MRTHMYTKVLFLSYTPQCTFITFIILPYAYSSCFQRAKPNKLHPCSCPMLTSSPPLVPRIPEGQVDVGPMAVGRLRSLEEQLTRAKQKIHSFQTLTGDGEQGVPGHRGGVGRGLRSKPQGRPCKRIRRCWRKRLSVCGTMLFSLVRGGMGLEIGRAHV